MASGLKAHKKRLPVQPYIYKWLVHRHGYKQQLVVSGQLVASNSSNRIAIANHFKNEEGLPEIIVVAYYSNNLKLYTLANVLEEWFNAELMNHTAISVKHGIPAMQAIRSFLNSCKIAEQELALATAYKRWQRLGLNLPGIRIE